MTFKANRTLKATALALSLLALTACGSLHKTAPGWAAPIRPPAELLEPIPAPVLPEKPTNGDLAEALDSAFDVIERLNDRLRAIRDL